MIDTKSEDVTDVSSDIRPPIRWRLWKTISGLKVPVFSLMLFGLFTIKSFYPDLFAGKRQKSYRFRADALGFFVGDLSLFNSNTAQEAETRIVNVFPEKLRPKVAKVITPVLSLCEKHGVDPFWVLSVMWTESNFRFQVTSIKGATGLMQVMPDTYNHLISVMKSQGIVLEADQGEAYLAQNFPEAYKKMGAGLLANKMRNLEVGIFYLNTLLKEFDSNHFHATIAYNMGPHWTKERLKNNQPVGKKNHYLHKVMQAYLHITKNLSHNANVSFIP
jgi:hypothetical protein